MQYARVCAMTVVVGALGLAGCSPDGGEAGQKPAAASSPAVKKPVGPYAGLSAAQVGQKAVAATKSLAAFRVVTTMQEEGKPLTKDYRLNKQGQCTGRYRVGGPVSPALPPHHRTCGPASGGSFS
ncbi:hypothetical protein ABT160_39745 [Streptomyces sp. NPDC001941]|uniref:hypothetical protein n=1 Tax=Streptomyces sp. NPDC001941 TaxID=3154659 RepID=UPI00332AA4F8